jgi:pimeloyl-ACP methyl ester carboxylesterase
VTRRRHCLPRRALRRVLLSAGAAALFGQTAPIGAQPASPSACWLKGVAHEARCGQVQRALDPARAGGQTIELHFAVLPALARNKLPDPVFFLAGGPGQSAIELAGPLSAMLARFGNRRDIVLVDQRGTGRSAPLACDEDAAALPLRDTVDPQRQVQRALQCLQRLQALPHGDLRLYSTPIAAADLDAVRRALGAPRINLIGASYGTRVALDYLRQFPQRARRVVLDGVVPPDMALHEASARDAQAAFDALLRSCEGDASCRIAHPRLRTSWQQLLQSVPRTVKVPHPLTGRKEELTLTRDMLLGLLRTVLYSPVLSAALPAALDAAALGELTPLFGLSSALGRPRGESSLAQGMHFSVVCGEDLRHGAAGAPARDFGDGLASMYRQVCAHWPRADVPAAFYALARAPVAVLLLSGGIDPVTPPRHGQRVADALGPLARHEVVPNAGHGLLALPCLRDVVFRFVDAATDAQALDVDTACARAMPRPPPFQPPGSAP